MDLRVPSRKGGVPKIRDSILGVPIRGIVVFGCWKLPNPHGTPSTQCLFIASGLGLETLNTCYCCYHRRGSIILI